MNLSVVNSDLFHGEPDDVHLVLEGSAVQHSVAIAVLVVDTVGNLLQKRLQHSVGVEATAHDCRTEIRLE